MLFNPFFVQTDTQTDLISTSKTSKLNNASYLFSDIIKVVNENNSQSNISSETAQGKYGNEDPLLNSLSIILNSLNQVDSNDYSTSNTSNEMVNLADLVKGLIPENSKNGMSISESLENTSQSKDTKTINLLTNSSDVNSFLQFILNQFPALKITPVDEKKFLVQPTTNKDSGNLIDEKQKIEEIISNFLQTNNNVMLNFNIGSKKFNVTIQKIEGSFNFIKGDTKTDSVSKFINASGNEHDEGISNSTNEYPNNYFIELVSGSNTNALTNKNGNNVISSLLAESKNVLKNDGNNQTEINGQQENKAENVKQPVVNAAEYENNSVKTGLFTNDNQTVSLNGNSKDNVKVVANSAEIESQNHVENGIQSLQSEQAVSLENLPVNKQFDKVEMTISETPDVPTSSDSKNQKTPDNNYLGQTPDGISKIIYDNKAETNSSSSAQMPKDDGKFVITIKVMPETTTDVKNTTSTQSNSEWLSLLHDATLTNSSQIQPEDKKTIEPDRSNLELIKKQNTQEPVRELFEPPLVLKLSLKHQLKSIEQTDLKAMNTSVNHSSLFEKENILDTSNLRAENNTQKQIQTEIPILNGNATEVTNGNAINSTGTDVINNTSTNDSIAKDNEIIAPVLKEQVLDSKDVKSNETGNVSDINKENPFSNNVVNRIAAIENNIEDSRNEFSKNKTKDEISDFVASQVTDKNTNQIFKMDKVPDNVNQLNNSIKTIEVANLSKEISKFVSQGESKNLVLQLKPEDLGKIKISLDVAGNAVNAHVEVENESVKQMVQSHIDNLKQSLNLNGLQLSTLDVALSGGEQKPSRFFSTKKKSQYSAASNKIEELPDTIAAKKLGYNTYEYLI